MPDKYIIKFIKEQIPQYFIQKIDIVAESTIVLILKVCSCIASKREGRSTLLSRGVFDIAMRL